VATNAERKNKTMVKIQIEIDDALATQLIAQANDDGKTINQQVTKMIEYGVCLADLWSDDSTFVTQAREEVLKTLARQDN